MKHWWSKGRMVACHAVDPGSSPGQCNFFYLLIDDIFGHLCAGGLAVENASTPTALCDDGTPTMLNLECIKFPF